MARTKTTSKLPLGVSAVANRPGLYRLSVMISGKRYSEYHRPDDELTQRQLQSALQKAVDAFRDKAERGSLRGQVTDKSRFSEAVEWYLSTAKMELRESTMKVTERTFAEYITPTLGNIPLRQITTPMVTSLFSELSERGGGQTVFVAKTSFVELINDQTPRGKVNDTAGLIGIAENTFFRVRYRHNVNQTNAQKTADYFNTPLDKAFDKIEDTRPLKASFVGRIAACLSALFTALVKADVLLKNPVLNAAKPRVGEAERGAYLDKRQLPIFLNALEIIGDDSARVCLILCLQLGLRSGEARGLQWSDIDFLGGIVSINHSVGETANGLILGETKTVRSRRKLPLSPYLYGLLSEYHDRQAAYAASIGSSWTDNNLVCPNSTGGLMTKTPPYLAVKRITNAHKELPQDLHPHSLRHSFVSLLISSGLDVVTVASLAGDTVEVISKIYAHSFAEREAAAMDKIGGVFAQISATAAPPLIEEQ
ncbi:hypothetical protein FACS18949_04530 [Clostridia bacterium]|nr:hypothetical protein FACS18949_04530 [Clostridia bacterium]